MEISTPRILTNMAFWQSPLWRERTDSIRSPDRDYEESTARSAFGEALQLYRRRGDYDVILTMGIRESICYGLLCLLTGVRSKQIMTEVFIDHEQPHSPAWRLKTRLYARVARRAIGILTNSSGEIATIAKRFELSADQLLFVPLNATIEPVPTQEDVPAFILSAGRTLRDYDLIIEAAPTIPAPVTIVCGRHDLADAQLPDSVTVLRETPRATYLDHLRRCAVVILPLRAAGRSTGQVVMLEAMAMGKPVITTRSPGTTDYIREGENGVLIPSRDADALADACRRMLSDPNLRKRIGDTAREDVRRLYSHDGHARAKLEAIRRLCN